MRGGYPLIVKPTDRSGSRGIYKAYCDEDLRDAVAQAIELSFEKAAIIEEYIDGNEYSCESISFGGEHTILTFTKKYTTGEPCFIETGHVEPSDIDDNLHEGIKLEIMQALDALHIEYGASHAEFKIDNCGNARIIEIGARMGGDCIGSDLVFLSTGFDYLKMVIDIAFGERPNFEKEVPYSQAKVKFIYSEEDVDEMERLMNDSDWKFIRKSASIEVKQQRVVDSSTRFGFYIVCR